MLVVYFWVDSGKWEMLSTMEATLGTPLKMRQKLIFSLGKILGLLN